MKNLLFLSILVLAAQICKAQESTGRLEGIIVRSQTNESLEGANVTLVGTQKGDATDKKGTFKIEQIRPGKYEVKIQLIGYRTHHQKIQIQPDKTTKIYLTLEPAVLDAPEVTVEGERVEDIRLQVSPPSFKLEPNEVKEMAGAFEDVMRSVFSLPGVQATSDFGNQFIVRGGGPDQNLVLVDDVEIFNPYRNSGMPSLINPSIVREVNLYAGAFPALFGDRLSSVLTVHTRDGSTQKWLSGQIGLNLVNANFLFEGKAPLWNGSWLVSNRRTYNQLFAESYAKRLTSNNVALPDFEDWHIKVALHPSPKHRLQFHSILGSNNQAFLIKEDLGEQDSERETLDGDDKIKTNIVGGSWNYLLSQRFQTKIYANWYKNSGNSSFAGDFLPANDGAALRFATGFATEPPPVFSGGDSVFVFAHDQRFDFRKLAFGGWLVYEHGRHVIESGFGFDFLKNSIDSQLSFSEFGKVVFDALQTAPNFFGALGDSIDQRKSYHRSNIYVQDKWTVLGGKAFVQPGLRFDYYDLIKRGYVSPRLKASYHVNAETTISAAWGIYRQSPGFEKLLDGGRVFDLLKFEDLSELSAEKAVHNVFAVQRQFGDQWHLTVETYYKRFDDLIDQTIELVERPVAVYLAGQPGLPDSYRVEKELVFKKNPKAVNDVTGNAYGLDVRLEKGVSQVSDCLSGWLSYSFGKSMRTQTFDDRRMSYPYDFDRRHSVDVVLNQRIGPKLTLGLTWRHGTGFPYTPALAVEPLVAEVASDPSNPDLIKPTILTDPETGAARFVPTFGGPENINSRRYPDYQRLDVRMTYSTKWLHSEWQFYLDFVNLLNRKNVLLFRSIVRTEIDESLPQSLQFLRVRAFEEPVNLYPFIPSFGVHVAF
ncbi:TonB-dependent receptor [candidate division KSB1 bacterium]|nr:TonB-dependent receptor [candidate division KSB1 bacterium]